MNHIFTLYKGFWKNEIPPHLSIKLPKECVRNLLSKGGYGLRNTYEWDLPQETSFWFVIKDTFGGLDEMSSKKRTQVRKSLKTYDIRRVTADEILEVGFSIYNAAMESYRVKAKAITKEQYRARIQLAEKTGKAEYWCVYLKETGEAVALAINTISDDCCEYNTMKCDPKFMRNSTYPYYGLIYEMNRYYLEERNLDYVNDGARSITGHSNIQEMLVDVFNFRKAHCRLQIEYKWWFRIAVNILYPFRRLLPFASVKSILNMEEMRRNQE